MAAARPAGPLPTIATFFPVLFFGFCEVTNPCLKAYSITALSFAFVATASVCNPHVQAASHNAGQTLDVNSGKECV